MQNIIVIALFEILEVFPPYVVNFDLFASNFTDDCVSYGNNRIY